MDISHQWKRLARMVDPQARKNPDLLYSEVPRLTALWKKIPQGVHEEVPYKQQQIDSLWDLLALQYPSEITETWASTPELPRSVTPSELPRSIAPSEPRPQTIVHPVVSSFPPPTLSVLPGLSEPTQSQSDEFSFTPSIFSISSNSTNFEEVSREEVPQPQIEPAAPPTANDGELMEWAKQEDDVGRAMATGDLSNHLAFREAIAKLQSLPLDVLEVDLARIQGRGPNFNEFLVEHAKSGRATCSSCRKPIDQGTLRIANAYFAVGFDGNKYYWRHWWCFARSQKNVNRPEHWDGWNRLKDADKAKISKLVPRPVSYGLTRVPGMLSCFRTVKTLDLRENSLEVLPVELASLGQLERLDLNHNQFSSLPEVLLQLPCLKWVDLRNNPLATSEGIMNVIEMAKQRNPGLKIEI